MVDGCDDEVDVPEPVEVDVPPLVEPVFEVEPLLVDDEDGVPVEDPLPFALELLP